MKPQALFASLVITLVSTAASAQIQIITRLNSGVNAHSIAAFAGVTLLDSAAPFALFVTPAGQESDFYQARLQSAPGVVWAEDDENISTPEDLKTKGGSLSVIGGRDELVVRNKKMLRQIHWNSYLANQGTNTVRMAILDTGLSKQQPELWKMVDAFEDEQTVGGNADDLPMGIDSNQNGIFDEGVGHGTMVAGIVNIVAPKVRLLIAKVADSDGHATAWTLIKGLVFAHNNGAVVANVSLGSPMEIVALSDVSDWCDEVGLYWVAPAGNTNQAQAWYPAKISSVVCVTGLDAHDRKADFSNWDSGAVCTAPAVGITTQWWDGTLGQGSGTSFAAPFVSASIAEFLRHRGTVSESIQKTVHDAGSSIDLQNMAFKGKLGTKINFLGLLLSQLGGFFPKP